MFLSHLLGYDPRDYLMNELKKLASLLGVDIETLIHLAAYKEKSPQDLTLELMSILNLSGMREYRRILKAVSLIDISQLEYTYKPYQAI